MFKRTIPLLVLLTFMFSCQKQAENQINYTISHSVEDSIPLLKVNMKFKADSSGITKLEFPNDAWGQKDLYSTLQSTRLVNVQGEIKKDLDSGWIILKHPKDVKELEFEYQLKQDFEDPVSSQRVYRPIITPEYFHVFSHNLFMVPKNLGPELDIELDWVDFPENYTIHNSFGSGQRQQALEPLEKELFGSAIFVGGDFRVLKEEINGNDISLATRGEWVPFEEEKVMEVLKQTLTCQRNFWNDHSQEYFTVTMQPFPQESGSSFQGTGLTNSFATSISNNEFTDIGQLVYLFNHELMHNWIGHAIENVNEEEQYWFSEGFTEYYTFKNIARNNINWLPADYYIEEINSAIRNLYASPVSEAPNSEINYDNFWSNQDYSKLPYYRGTLFAFYLDQKIQRISGGTKSLNDVMLQIFKDAKTKGQKLGHEYFLGVMKAYWDEDFEPFFKVHILNGKHLDLVGLFEDLGVEYSPRSNIFELGFQFTEDKKKIEEVTEGSSAWEAGLREGDEVFSRSIWHGNISKKVELGVRRDGKELDIEFYPIKEADVPQMQVNPSNLNKLGF